MIRLQGGLRQFRRVIPPLDAPVRVEAVGKPELALETGDISEGGMELLLPEPPPVRVGDELSLVLKLPGEPALRVTAEVRHMDRMRVGVAFVDLPGSGREAIRRYVARVTHGSSWWQRLRELWQD